jgi:predicted ATPase
MQCPQCQYENPDGTQYCHACGTELAGGAHHSSGAEAPQQVVAALQHAGQQAAQRSAHTEAIAHCTKGLEVLKTLPNTPERLQQELTFHITLGAALIATQGRAAPEVEYVYARAQELCQQVEASSQLFEALASLWSFYIARSELQTARALGEQLLNLARSLNNPRFVESAYYALGATLFCLGPPE